MVDRNPGRVANGTLFHKNGDAEISDLAEKVTPVNADWILLEDSADGDSKKKAQVGNLPGGGGGDSITVNGAAVVDADFDDTTPAAPAGEVNVKWQKDASSPANVSASVQASSTTQKGVVELATTAEVNTGTDTERAITPDAHRNCDLHRETFRFVINGKPNVDRTIDGAWIAPRACTIQRITLYRRTAGSSGSTIVDVNKNGTTVYTTQGNRPTVTQAGGNDQIDATTDMDVTAVAQNDRIEVAVDAVEAGNPQDISVIIEVSY